MSKAIFDGIKALFPPGTRVHLYRAELSNPPRLEDFPYVVLHGGWGEEVSGEPGDRSSDDIPDQVAFTLRCTVAALSLDGLSEITTTSREALNRQRPTVTGWRFSKLRQQEVLTAEPDNRVSVDTLNPVYLVDEYPFTAYRA
ncbi:hypothetical protein [Glutamicibacter sp.]|uniref:hypothetical protein n=1 Tax=Glutamicibacter sp. TaxID=1931995 RepID=UPI0028BE3F96|nr:hypothetical protein [Glutamicibacter sp.]